VLLALTCAGAQAQTQTPAQSTQPPPAPPQTHTQSPQPSTQRLNTDLLLTHPHVLPSYTLADFKRDAEESKRNCAKVGVVWTPSMGFVKKPSRSSCVPRYQR
jgi:hypothetical protein